MTSRLASVLVGAALACALVLALPAFATQRTGACGDKFVAPAASSLALVGADDGTLISPANATGPADGWAAASLPVSLPSVASLSGNPWTVCGTSDNNKAVVFLAPSLAVPGVPVLSQTAGGSLTARTYFVAVTYTNLTGETTVSAEATLAVGANNRLVVAGPASSGNATGWNLYVGTLTGNKTLQNASPMVLGVNFTEPLVGLISGAVPPTGNTASSAYILDGGRVLLRYLVGGTNYQTATLSSDGANYRVVSASNETRQIAGATTGFPARYGFPSGPGYQTTQGDNSTAISSGATSGGLTVTLPSVTNIAAGWTARFNRDAGKDMTINVNSTNGSLIVYPGASTSSLLLAPVNGESVTLQYDGGAFRVLAISPATATLIGVSGALGHVTNNATLKLAKGSLGSSIFRDGFYNQGDGGAAKYNWSGTNCASPDNGAQVQPTGVTGCWIVDFAAIPANITQWGAKPDDTTDIGQFVQAAYNANIGSCVTIPAGIWMWTSAVTMTTAPPCFKGEGFNETPGFTLSPTTFLGTWIHIPHSAVNTTLVTITGITGQGASTGFSQMGFYEDQPPSTGGWTPYPYQWIFDLDGNLGRVDFDSIMFLNTTHCIKFNNSARSHVTRIKGQPQGTCLQYDGMRDVSELDQVEFWTFWTNADFNINHYDFLVDPIIYYRADSPHLGNIFVFGYHSGIRFDESLGCGALCGSTTGFQLDSLQSDGSKYGVWVFGNNVQGQIGNLRGAGIDWTSTGPIFPGSEVYRDDGLGTVISIANFQCYYASSSCVEIAGLGTVQIANPVLFSYNWDNNNSPGFNANVLGTISTANQAVITFPQHGAPIIPAYSTGGHYLMHGLRQNWLPSLSGTTTTGTYLADYILGRFWYDGSLVTFTFNISVHSAGGFAGALAIQGLPFQYNMTDHENGFCYIANHSGIVLDTGYTELSGIMPGGGGVNQILLVESGGGLSTQPAPTTLFGSSFAIGGTCTMAFGQ